MNMETNKIFAAVLVAGIIAYTAGITARGMVHTEHVGTEAFPIEAAEAATGGSSSAVPEVAEDISALLASADLAKGEKISKICAACHTFDKGGKNMVGPNLNGIVGNKQAHAADFAYSDAMKTAGGTWTVEMLNAFLWNPKKTVPGTKMSFAGLKKPEDRAAIIKWLQAQK